MRGARRDRRHRHGDDPALVAEVIIGKQRNGPIGTANVAFLHEFTRFENLAREYSPRPGD